MITFRFYLVTLVAIFLAVALGVVIGSTFLEPALVQDLNNQVASVRENLDERVARIDDLTGQIDDLDEYVESSAPFAVDGSLDGAVVLVAANEGVEAAPVERLVSRLRQAGATTDGIVWLQPGMGTGERTEELVETLELEVDPNDPAQVSAATWAAVVEGVAGVVDPALPPGTTVPTDTTATTATDDSIPVSTSDTPTSESPETTAPVEGSTTAPASLPPGTTATTTVTDTSLPVPAVFDSEALGLLADAGWIRLQSIEVAEPAASRPVPSGPPALAVVLVTGAEAEAEGPAVVDLARQQAAAGVATVVAEVWVDANDEEVEARGALLLPIREDAELSARVSTVDDLDLIQGQVATALAIRDLGSGIAGHYGYGPSAELVLPPWLGP